MKLIQTIILSMLCTPIMASCNNSKAINANNQAVSETSTSAVQTTSKEISKEKGVAGQIASVTKKGKAIFLVVFNKKGADKDKAISIAKKALAKKSNSAEIIELNTTEASNKDLITKFSLAGAPLPLIIVMDKNGIPAGGLKLAEATPDALADMIPSPKNSEVIKALNEKKAVFIIAYKEKMIEKKKAITNCINAAKVMKNEAAVVLLNTDNKAEKLLISNLQIDINSTEPAIYTVNKSGQITGTFTPKTSIAQLTVAASKVMSGCGGGCASGCN